MVLYLTVNRVDLCHGYVYGALTWDIKDILWMDDHVLIMSHKFLATKSSKYHILGMV